MQDGREASPPNPEIVSSAAVPGTATHGIEVAVEFKPVEHPIEPQDSDHPIECPLPEPSILNVCLNPIYMIAHLIHNSKFMFHLGS